MKKLFFVFFTNLIVITFLNSCENDEPTSEAVIDINNKCYDVNSARSVSEAAAIATSGLKFLEGGSRSSVRRVNVDNAIVKLSNNKSRG